jgi:flagellar basal body-associated protein FliL
MNRITIIIAITVAIVALTALIVFSVNPQQQAPRTNSSQPNEINNLTVSRSTVEDAYYVPATIINKGIK